MAATTSPGCSAPGSGKGTGWASASELVAVNGQPGARFLDPRGRLVNVISLDIADGAVQTVRSVINPDKLAHLGPLSPVGRRSARPDWA